MVEKNLNQKDDIEEEIEEMEKEEIEEDLTSSKKQDGKVKDTYEVFSVEPRIGIVNSITGETMENFEKKDQALLIILKDILNKLNRLEISQGI